MIFTYGEGVHIFSVGLRGGGGGDSLRGPGGLPALGHQHREKSVGAGNTGGPGHYPEHYPSGGVPQVQEEEEINGDKTTGQAEDDTGRRGWGKMRNEGRGDGAMQKEAVLHASFSNA